MFPLLTAGSYMSAADGSSADGLFGASYRTRPQPTEVLQGQTVTMSCSFDGLADDDTVFWQGGPEDKIIAFGRTVPKVYRRHRITGDASRGEYNLEITGVKLEDDGKYSCYTDPKSAADTILTVVVPMTGPPAVKGGELSVTSGDQLSLTCRASGGHPAPRLTWLNGTHRFRTVDYPEPCSDVVLGSPRISRTVIYPEPCSDVVLDSPRVSRTEPGANLISWIRRDYPEKDASVSTEDQSLELFLPRVTKWDHGANFTCRADQGFPQLARPKASSRILRVKYPPAVSVPSPSVHVREGEPASLSCMVDSNPKATVTWRKVGGAIPILNMMRDHVLHLPKVSRHDGGLYHCDANNGVLPKGTGTVTLQVYYPPVIEATMEDQVTILYGKEDRYEMLFCSPDRPSCDRGYHGGPDPPLIEATMEDQVTMLYGQDDQSLQCLADGNPKPHIRWRRKDTSLYWDNPLRFHRVRYDVQGTYQCVAASDGFREVTKDVYVDVVGKPSIQRGQPAVTVAAGNTARFHCEILADPLPGRVSWFRQSMRRRGEETVVMATEVGVSITENPVDDGTSSTLLLKDVGKSQEGTYICQAANMFGEARREIRLQVFDYNQRQLVIKGRSVYIDCGEDRYPVHARSQGGGGVRNPPPPPHPHKAQRNLAPALEVPSSSGKNPAIQKPGYGHACSYHCKRYVYRVTHKNLVNRQQWITGHHLRIHGDGWPGHFGGNSRLRCGEEAVDLQGGEASPASTSLGPLHGCCALGPLRICCAESREEAGPWYERLRCGGPGTAGVGRDPEATSAASGDKQWTNVGLSYSELAHAHATTLPPYTTVERHRPDGEDIRACAREDIPEEDIVPYTGCLPMGVPTPPPKAAKGKRHVRAPSGEILGHASVREAPCLLTESQADSI
ncbi:hypothetical protein Bbelb_312990 [Branchiostoma belcheri]|nr:hypothetical protein Bbelb_312990 [Branchiostoma belcheri]